MGMDLSVCPDTFGLKGETVLAYDRLRINRDYDLFERVRSLRPRPLDTAVAYYEDDGLADRTTDPYGADLTYLTAGELSAIDPGTGTLARAVWAYLDELPRDTKIVLWWH